MNDTCVVRGIVHRLSVVSLAITQELALRRYTSRRSHLRLSARNRDGDEYRLFSNEVSSSAFAVSNGS